MSRIAKKPIAIPDGVEVILNGNLISVKSKTDELRCLIHDSVKIKKIDNFLYFSPNESIKWSFAGTMRSLLYNMIIGVTEGFTKKLKLVGVGYRVSVKNNIVNLSLGFSHSIDYILPLGITAICLSPTEILLKSADKQVVGQVSSELRAYRPPEPYKGKGILYFDENLKLKEAKKKN